VDDVILNDIVLAHIPQAMLDDVFNFEAGYIDVTGCDGNAHVGGRIDHGSLTDIVDPGCGRS
jgi:hypothetical protein